MTAKSPAEHHIALLIGGEYRATIIADTIHFELASNVVLTMSTDVVEFSQEPLDENTLYEPIQASWDGDFLDKLVVEVHNYNGE